MSAYPPPIENTPIFDSGLFLAPGTTTGSLAGSSSTATNLAGGIASQIPYQSAPDTTTFLVTGSAGTILTSGGGSLAPYWSSPSLTNATNLSNGTANQIPYQSAPDTTLFIGPGTDGQLLKSNGSSAAPAFEDAGFASLTTTNAFTGTTTQTYTGTSRIVTIDPASTTTILVTGNPVVAGTQSSIGPDAIFTQNVNSGSGGTLLFKSAGTTKMTLSSTGVSIPTLTSTAATLTGSLTGNASTATALAGGAVNQIPYQTGAGATTFLSNSGTAGFVLTATAGAPEWAAATGGGASLTASNAFTNTTNTFTQSTNVTTINPNFVSLSSNSGTNAPSIASANSSFNSITSSTLSISGRGIQSGNTPNYNLVTTTPASALAVIPAGSSISTAGVLTATIVLGDIAASDNNYFIYLTITYTIGTNISPTTWNVTPLPPIAVSIAQAQQTYKSTIPTYPVLSMSIDPVLCATASTFNLSTNSYIRFNAIQLQASQIYNGVGIFSSTAANNKIQVGIYDATGALMASSPSAGTNVIAVQGFSIAFSAPFTCTSTGIYYIALLNISGATTIACYATGQALLHNFGVQRPGNVTGAITGDFSTGGRCWATAAAPSPLQLPASLSGLSLTPIGNPIWCCVY